MTKEKKLDYYNKYKKTIRDTLYREFTNYNKELKNIGGKNNKDYKEWKNKVITLYESIKKIFESLYNIEILIFDDNNDEFIEEVYIFSNNTQHELMDQFYIGRE